MTLSVEKRPYELLLRWDVSGKLSGAHVQWRFVTIENGRPVAESVGAAEGLSVAGFPLRDILKKSEADALSAYSDLLDKCARLQRENERLKQINAGIMMAPASEQRN